jgi:hypothetical protein
MALNVRALALAGVLVGTTFAAAPASAATLPAGLSTPASTAFSLDYSRFDPADGVAGYHCRRWGCGGGWGRRGWRRNRIDAGDVLIGAVILGGIAAIANSNNRRERDRDVVIVERDQRDWDRRDDRRLDDRRTGPRGTGASGLDNAVSMCLDRIERDVRVDTVDNVERTSVGWVVSGALFNGSPFQCRIGNNGQIDGVDYSNGLTDIGMADAPLTTDPRADGQWSDERYAAARAALAPEAQSMTAPAVQTALAPMSARPEAAPRRPEAMPAYPGGPIPGEVIPETDEEANGG